MLPDTIRIYGTMVSPHNFCDLGHLNTIWDPRIRYHETMKSLRYDKASRALSRISRESVRRRGRPFRGGLFPGTTIRCCARPSPSYVAGERKCVKVVAVRKPAMVNLFATGLHTRVMLRTD